MNGEADFGPLLEALVTCVGVIDVVSLFAFTLNLKSAKESSTDDNNNDVRSMQRVRDKSSKIDQARSIPQVVVDGVAPITRGDDDDVIDSLVSKVNELETKLSELEVRSRESSMERFVEGERYIRSRSPSPYPQDQQERYRRSRSPSPYPSGAVSKDDETSSYDGETNTSSSESRASSIRHPSKLITRDDEFRKTKRSSQISHCSREEELMELTKLEQQENDNMDDFVQIHYEGQDEPGQHFRHGISPIQEVPSCPIHGGIEGSPEPGMSTMTDRPWGDIKKDVADIRKSEKKDQMRRSLSIDEQPAAEEKAGQVEPPKVSAVNVNEMFIKNEQISMQQSSPSKMLVKQAHVASEEHPEETMSDLELIPLPVVEIFTAPVSVENSLNEINVTAGGDFKQDVSDFKGSTKSLEVVKGTSTAVGNDYAVRSTTPEPDVSMHKITITDTNSSELDVDAELLNISGSPSSGEGLRRTKRCIDSLDRSASRSSSRLSRGRRSKSPSVASQEDYKEWFDKFDNHITSNLTLPEDDFDEFESDVEEDFLLRSEDGNLNGAEICHIEDDIDTRDVSVSVTVNLRKSKSPVECFPCAEFQQERKGFKTKGEEFLELERFRENKQRRISIVPSTEEQQKNYVSILHPEEFPPKDEAAQREPHQHHEHLHNVGYNEWMKKIVDHHSSHLATSDSDSDSDVSLDEVRMLPLFYDDKHAK